MGWDAKDEASLRKPGSNIRDPICAVSRSELQSGRYLQNIKSYNLPTPIPPGQSSGNGTQHHVNYTSLVAPRNFGVHLKAVNYTTAMFGKWMNEYNGKIGPGGKILGTAPGGLRVWATET
jgi:hypothetical protein